MDRTIPLVLVSSVLIFASVLILEGNSEAFHPPCLGQKVNYTELEYIALGECVMDLSPPPKQPNDSVTESTPNIRKRIRAAMNDSCFYPCFMGHKKMFKDGYINVDVGEKFIGNYPTEAREKLKQALKKCAKPIKETELSMKNNCSDYQGFLKCYFDDEEKICGRNFTDRSIVKE